jgi:hypothetical protein
MLTRRSVLPERAGEQGGAHVVSAPPPCGDGRHDHRRNGRSPSPMLYRLAPAARPPFGSWGWAARGALAGCSGLALGRPGTRPARQPQDRVPLDQVHVTRVSRGQPPRPEVALPAHGRSPRIRAKVRVAAVFELEHQHPGSCGGPQGGGARGREAVPRTCGSGTCSYRESTYMHVRIIPHPREGETQGGRLPSNGFVGSERACAVNRCTFDPGVLFNGPQLSHRATPARPGASACT